MKVIQKVESDPVVTLELRRSELKNIKLVIGATTPSSISHTGVNQTQLYGLYNSLSLVTKEANIF